MASICTSNVLFTMGLFDGLICSFRKDILSFATCSRVTLADQLVGERDMRARVLGGWSMCYNMLIHAHRMKCLKLILESGYYMYMNDLSRKRDWRQEGAVSSLQTRFFSVIPRALGC